jgi:hypothetical protein
MDLPQQQKRFPRFKRHNRDAILVEISDSRPDDLSIKGRCQFLWQFVQPVEHFNQVTLHLRTSLICGSKFYETAASILGQSPDNIIKLFGFDGLVERLLGHRNNLVVDVLEMKPGKFRPLLLSKIRPPRSSSPFVQAGAL